MRRLAAHTLLLVLLTRCGFRENELTPVPSNLVQRDTLVLLLAESAIFNAQSQHRDTRKKLFKDIILQREKDMFDSLGVSQADFKTSIEYYARNPKDMENMYDQAMNILTTRLAEVGKKPDKDSVNSTPIVLPKELQKK
ncbi:MAG: DUF4296 domain-containing protein [Flavobacteriales bacterium]